MTEAEVAIGNGNSDIQKENTTDKGKENHNSFDNQRTITRNTMSSMHHVLIAFIVLIVVVTTVSLAIVLSPKEEPLGSRPNILVVIADDLGYNDVGYQGQGDIKTPYIDMLARSSIVLQRHYTQPMCSPSRAALFTGRYPFRYGMGGSRAIYYGSKYGLDLSEYLLPQALQKEDYSTYLIGKWHLGFADWAMTPTRRGFDYFYGTYGGSTTYDTHRSFEGPGDGTREPGYDLFEDWAPETGDKVNHKVVPDPNETFSELLFTDKAVKIIENYTVNEEGVTRPNPFFMVVSYQNPHAPITPLEKDIERNKDIKNENRKKMAAMITSLDYGVGRLTSALEKINAINSTIIIFLSDNGGHLMMPNGESFGSSNLPFRGAKCTLYEGGVRTPAFIKIPHSLSGTMDSSVKYDGLFHISDWLPTIMGLTQLSYPEELKLDKLDGIDHSETFQELLSGKPKEEVTTPRDHVVLDIDPVFDQAAIIQGKYKLIVGDPAFMDFDQVYPLINEDTIAHNDLVLNASRYRVSPKLFEQMMNYSRVPIEYEENAVKCLSLDCMSTDRTLYDLSWDFTESNDIAWRFKAETAQLYETLRKYSNSSNPIVKPHFNDWNDQSMKNDTELGISNVFTPWLNTTTYTTGAGSG